MTTHTPPKVKISQENAPSAPAAPKDLAGSIPPELLMLVLENFLPISRLARLPVLYTERLKRRKRLKVPPCIAHVASDTIAQTLLQSAAFPHVRDIIVYPKCAAGLNENRPVSPQRFKEVLEYCKSLQKLSVHLKGRCECVQNLSIAPSSTLSTLDISCDERLALGELATLLKYAPTIEKLSIHSAKSGWADADILRARLPNLRTLHLHIGSQSVLAMDFLLSHLFSIETLSSIETLELDRIEFFDKAEALDAIAVEALATSLQSIKISIPEAAPRRPRLASFEPFHRLRKIEFDRYGAPSLLRSINEIFTDCPRSVEEIVYTMYVDEIFDLELPIDPEVFQGKSLKKVEACNLISEARFMREEFLSLAQPYIQHLASHGIELSLHLA